MQKHLPGDDHGHDHSHSHAHHSAHNDHHSHSHSHTSDLKEMEMADISLVSIHSDHSHEHSHSKHDSDHSSHHSDHHTNEEESSQVSKKAKENINIRAAYIHVLSDLVQSIAVLIAGLVIMWRPEWQVIDPILTIIFCPIIFYTTLGVIRTSMRILLEGSPRNINVNELWLAIANVDGITRVINMQVWSINHGTSAMTVHAYAEDPQSALHTVHAIAREYGVDHATVQLESTSSSHFVSNQGAPYFYSPTNRGSSRDGVSFLQDMSPVCHFK